MKTTLNTPILLGLVCVASMMAQATPLNYAPDLTPPAPVLDAGWAYDEVTDAYVDSTDSAYVFGLSGPAVFSITDAYVAGDNFSVYDNGTLILQANGGPPDLSAWTDNPDVAWADPAFAHGSTTLAAGAHTLTVQSDLATGMGPAGFFTRLDTVTAPDSGSVVTIAGCVWGAMLGLGVLRRNHT